MKTWREKVRAVVAEDVRGDEAMEVIQGCAAIADEAARKRGVASEVLPTWTEVMPHVLHYFEWSIQAGQRLAAFPGADPIACKLLEQCGDVADTVAAGPGDDNSKERDE